MLEEDLGQWGGGCEKFSFWWSRMQEENARTTMVLIIKISALGDILAALAHIEAICAHHASDDVWLLTGPQAKSIFAEHPKLTIRVFTVHNLLSPDGLWATACWVRRNPFTRIYDLQGNKKSRCLCRYSKSDMRIGTRPDAAYDLYPNSDWTRTTRQNVYDRLSETLACAGVPRPDQGGTIFTNESDKQAISDFLSEFGLIKREFVVIHTGCSRQWPSKRWPENHYSALAGMLEERGLRSVWTGSVDEAEINASVSAKSGIDATGKFDIRRLYLLAKAARFAVANDSAPMHLFSQAGIPVFALFGPTNWMWSHGFGQRENVIHKAVACSPCFKNACPKDKGHACMVNLTPAAVFDKIQQRIRILPASGGRQGV